MKSIKELKNNLNLKGKKIVLRVDFNVPLTQLPTINHQLPTTNQQPNGHLTTANRQPPTNFGLGDDFRIRAHKETINFLLNAGARVLLVSHHSDKNFSFSDYVSQIEKILEQKLTFLKDLNSATMIDHSGDTIFLLDNIRLFAGEEENDSSLAEKLSRGFDIYVNDAFSVCHREHSSVVAIIKFLPSYAGFLIEKETGELSKVLESPAEGKILLIGGGKVSTKAPLVENFTGKAEKILIGGAVANNFFKAGGFEIGKSVFNESHIEELKSLLDSPKIILPEDVIISADKEGTEATPFPAGDIDPSHYILDIGSETAKHFADLIMRAKMVIWNGPMGVFENAAFAEGTEKIVKAMSKTKARIIIGGEDTISAFGKFGNLSDVDFVSTGGGAMLDFLAGNRLPGLEALGYYKV